MNPFFAILGQASGGAAPSPQDSLISMLLMFGSIGLIFYFLILRPQKREQQRAEQMRNALKKGDRVVTIGGIHGVVTAVDQTNNIVTVQVDKNTKIDFSKQAIATVIPKEEARAASEEKKSNEQQ
ncbi:MAG: preprotein translocase subunit YajC [Candidatus Sumerlaeaceae bacterium]|nr:preprotein translocase subunit YajC [Candidatus Sumerlaeaceae bacterium]